MSNQSTIFETIRNNPGISPAGLSELLGMHKPNARRDALILAKNGLIEAWENGNGYAFFPVNEMGAEPSSFAGGIREYANSSSRDLTGDTQQSAAAEISLQGNPSNGFRKSRACSRQR